MQSGKRARAIGVISRSPAPGNVKTRLAADLGAEAAASLYSAFLRDVLVTAAAIPESSVTVFHPRTDDPLAIHAVRPPGVELRQESGTGYSQIIPNALGELLASSPVAALVGADSPSLPAGYILAAFEAIEGGEADIAISPAADGGFCLVAVDNDYYQIFQGVAWSSDQVFQQILASARRLGLGLNILPEWYDVDSYSDLEWLADDLAADVTLGAAATRAALRALRNAGVPVPEGQIPWRVDGRRVIHSAFPWRSLVEDRLRTHTESRIDYAYLETETAVWVVPVTGDGRVILVRQYRHPVGEIILEVPAGGGGNEPPILVAERELREETGGRARELIHISSYFPASAHVSHKGHVFLALGVELGEQELESTEMLAVTTVPFELALDMARRGEIADSQSALAILASEPTIRAALRR